MYMIRYVGTLVRSATVKSNGLMPSTVALSQKLQLSTTNTHEALAHKPENQQQQQQQQNPSSVNKVSI